MQILVTCNENPKLIQEVDCSSLEYNLKIGSFEIPAGGYIITSHVLFKALSVERDNSIFNILFHSVSEVEDFCKWLKGAESDAWASFSRMLD